MSIDIITTLLMMAPGSLEVEMTMQDGSTIKINLDVEKIRSELEEAKALMDKATSFEKEAAWLAERMAQVCRDCGDMCYRGDLPVCPLTSYKGGCQKATGYEWREAARKATEKEC